MAQLSLEEQQAALSRLLLANSAQDVLIQINARLKRIEEQLAVRNAGYVQSELPGLDAKRAPSHLGPENPAWRTWRSFAADLQRHEKKVRLEHGKVTKVAIASLCGWSAKTISRTMEVYGLHPSKDWPPSTWNALEERSGRFF